MRYLTCNEAAALMGISIRRVQQMCKNGEISEQSRTVVPG